MIDSVAAARGAYDRFSGGSFITFYEAAYLSSGSEFNYSREFILFSHNLRRHMQKTLTQSAKIRRAEEIYIEAGPAA